LAARKISQRRRATGVWPRPSYDWPVMDARTWQLPILAARKPNPLK